MTGLVLEVLTPDGMALREEGLSIVVVRRCEARFDPGSEVGILPGHAPMLVHLARGPVRYERGEERRELTLAGGFAEVIGDRVTIVSPSVAATA